jgi:hypothetical protein
MKRITARCRDEIALRRARRRKSVGGCRVAEFWPSPRTAEKAHNGASPPYGRRGKVRRFAIMWVLIPCLIFDLGKVADCRLTLARSIYRSNARYLMLFGGEEIFFSRKGMRPARLRVDCSDADLHLRNHRPRQTAPYLRG